MNPMSKPSKQGLRTRHGERGVTMLIVLVLLSVMLLGGMALARLTEIGTLATGNSGYRQAAMAASEVGLNTAFAAVKTIADENTSSSWYSPTAVAKDSDGVPTVDWTAAPSITVGAMTVRYVAERACTSTPVTNPMQQCLVKQVWQPDNDSRDASKQKIDPPNSRQFRITVQVTDNKGTQTFVQSLVTKG